MPGVGFPVFCRIAWEYTRQADPVRLAGYASGRGPESAEEWYGEYVWCVFCAGFSARVLAGLWARVREAYRDFALEGDVSRDAVLGVFGNARKVDATLQVREMLMGMCWPEFRGRYLTSLEAMQCLPYIGPVLACHLGRNMGWQVAKDDVHLKRLCVRFGFRDAREMCEEGARLLGQPVGAVDYAVWRYCRDYGTAQLRGSNVCG